MIVDANMVVSLGTVDAQKIAVFETDPCGTEQGHGSCMGGLVNNGIRGINTCTCLCRKMSAINLRQTIPGELWYDDGDRPFEQSPPFTNVGLSSGTIKGTSNCLDGYEGIRASRSVTDDGIASGYFLTCHLTIYVCEDENGESTTECHLSQIFYGGIAILCFLCCIYFFVRR